MKTLKESLFDIEKNIKSTPSIHGIAVNDKLWKECEKSFEWFRKNIVSYGTVEYEELGLKDPVHDVIYNEKDCVMWLDRDDRKTLTIICPETIWYNYVVDALGYIQTWGDEIDMNQRRPGILSMTFAKSKKYKSFYGLEYVDDVYGYVPETISDKAKKIIEKF